MQTIKKIIRITLNAKLVLTVKNYLTKLGLTHGSFINGFLHYLANNHILPFRKLSSRQEKTALKVAAWRIAQDKVTVVDKNKKLQKAVDLNIYNQALQVLKRVGLSITEGIRMLYESFALTGKMPYQFEIAS